MLRRGWLTPQQLVWMWRLWELFAGECLRRGQGLVEEDPALDGFAADGTLAHSVSTQLAGAMAAHEDHVLQSVQAHRTHGLKEEVKHVLVYVSRIS